MPAEVGWNCHGLDRPLREPLAPDEPEGREPPELLTPEGRLPPDGLLIPPDGAGDPGLPRLPPKIDVPGLRSGRLVPGVTRLGATGWRFGTAFGAISGRDPRS